MGKSTSKSDKQHRVASIQWVALLFAFILMLGCIACQGTQLSHESEPDGSAPSGSSQLPYTEKSNDSHSISHSYGVTDTSDVPPSVSTYTSEVQTSSHSTRLSTDESSKSVNGNSSKQTSTTTRPLTSIANTQTKSTTTKASTTKTTKATTTTTTSTKATTSVSNYITVKVWVECRNAVDYAGLSDFIERMISEKRCDENGNMYRKSLQLPREATAFDALIASGLDVNYSTSTVFGSKYVRAINTLNEKMAGGRSGWIYMVNGAIANQSADQWILKDGDTLHWGYTIVEGDVN